MLSENPYVIAFALASLAFYVIASIMFARIWARLKERESPEQRTLSDPALASVDPRTIGREARPEGPRSVAAVSAPSVPASLARSRPALPYVGADEAPAAVASPDSRVRAAPREDTQGSWIPAAPERPTRPEVPRAPAVAVVAPERDEQRDSDLDVATCVLARCGKCNSVNVESVGTIISCNACGHLGRLPGHRPQPPAEA